MSNYRQKTWDNLRWLTGQNLFDVLLVSKGELLSFVKNGLPAYDKNDKPLDWEKPETWRYVLRNPYLPNSPSYSRNTEQRLFDTVKYQRFKKEEVISFLEKHSLTHLIPAPAADEPEAVEDEPVLQTTATAPFTIPVPAGTQWNQICFRIVNDNRVEISHPEGMTPCRIVDLGFATRPACWTLLQLAGCHDGRLPPPAEKYATKQNINNLKTHIKSLFPNIKGEPIKHIKGEGYRCMFRVLTLPSQLNLNDHYKSDDKSEDTDWGDIMDSK